MEEILAPINQFPENLAKELVVENAFGYLLRGTSRLAEGKREEGLFDLETAKRLDPQDGHVRMTLGTAYQLSDPERSLLEYEQAAELFSEKLDSFMAAAAERAAKRMRGRLD